MRAAPDAHGECAQVPPDVELAEVVVEVVLVEVVLVLLELDVAPPEPGLRPPHAFVLGTHT